MFTIHGQATEMPSAIGAASVCPCMSSGSRMSGKTVSDKSMIGKKLWRIEKPRYNFSSQLDTQLANPLDT
jgi:hypothetical protein